MSKQKPKALITEGLRFGRFPITAVQPAVDGREVSRQGRCPARGLVVGATAFREGHDQLGVSAVLLDPKGKERQRVRLAPPRGDRGQGHRPLGRLLTPTGTGQLVLRHRGLA